MRSDHRCGDLLSSWLFCCLDAGRLSAQYNMFVENGRTGVMKRSGMTVALIEKHDHGSTSTTATLPVYTVSPKFPENLKGQLTSNFKLSSIHCSIFV